MWFAKITVIQIAVVLFEVLVTSKTSSGYPNKLTTEALGAITDNQGAENGNNQAVTEETSDVLATPGNDATTLAPPTSDSEKILIAVRDTQEAGKIQIVNTSDVSAMPEHVTTLAPPMNDSRKRAVNESDEYNYHVDVEDNSTGFVGAELEEQNSTLCDEGNGKTCKMCKQLSKHCHYIHSNKRCLYSVVIHKNPDYECSKRYFDAVDSSKAASALVIAIVLSAIWVAASCGFFFCGGKVRGHEEPFFGDNHVYLDTADRAYSTSDATVPRSSA